MVKARIRDLSLDFLVVFRFIEDREMENVGMFALMSRRGVGPLTKDAAVRLQQVVDNKLRDGENMYDGACSVSISCFHCILKQDHPLCPKGKGGVN